MANSMILEVTDVQPGQGNAPGTIVGFENGEPRTVKAFGDVLANFSAGQTFEFEWYMGKEYQGQQDMLVSKHGSIKSLGGGPNGSQSPVEATQRAKQTFQEPAPQKQTNTPQGVMTGSANTKDRSITILAVMKSVIESGGTEDDFRTWLSLHDQTLSLHGKNRG
jgi:hypothetical protein